MGSATDGLQLFYLQLSDRSRKRAENPQRGFSMAYSTILERFQTCNAEVRNESFSLTAVLGAGALQWFPQ
jgi:hypothetical protein